MRSVQQGRNCVTTTLKGHAVADSPSTVRIALLDILMYASARKVQVVQGEDRTLVWRRAMTTRYTGSKSNLKLGKSRQSDLNVSFKSLKINVKRFTQPSPPIHATSASAPMSNGSSTAPSVKTQENDHPINSRRWMEAYPSPVDRSACPLAEMTIDELEDEMARESIGTKNLVVVDVRRADCLVSYKLRRRESVLPSDRHPQSMIPGAINLPAHSFHVALPSLLHLLAPIPIVVFHCGRSNGRGPRAAGWYADALQKHLNLSDEAVSKRVRVLKGGIVAWEARFGQGSLQERGVTYGRATVQL